MVDAAGAKHDADAAVPLVCGFVSDVRQAQRVASRLMGLGVAESALSLLVGDEAVNGLAASSASGLSSGGRLQGATGWPGVATAVAVPGLGPCYAVGPIREALSAQGGGAHTSGVPTTLRRLGLSWADAYASESGIRHQLVWLALQTGTPALARRFRETLTSFGGRPLGPAVGAAPFPRQNRAD